MKDLNCASTQEQKSFFESFDQILCDVDGVVWHYPNTIPGADSAVLSLRKLGKKVIFVSNRTTKTHEDFYQHLKSKKFLHDETELIMPEVALISHLKKINFDKEIYLIGTTSLRNVLTKAGFKMADYPPAEAIEEIQGKFAQLSIILSDKVGAVVTDVDYNLSYLRLQKAGLYLKRPDVLYLTTNSSSRYLNTDLEIFNSALFDRALEDFSGRRALRLAKPSLDYNNFIKEKHEIGDPSRVLFIGDSIEDDLGFATNCNYQKLLVLSGNTQKDSIIPESYKPEYYINDLKVLDDIIKNIK